MRRWRHLAAVGCRRGNQCLINSIQRRLSFDARAALAFTSVGAAAATLGASDSLAENRQATMTSTTTNYYDYNDWVYDCVYDDNNDYYDN